MWWDNGSNPCLMAKFMLFCDSNLLFWMHVVSITTEREKWPVNLFFTNAEWLVIFLISTNKKLKVSLMVLWLFPLAFLKISTYPKCILYSQYWSLSVELLEENPEQSLRSRLQKSTPFSHVISTWFWFCFCYAGFWQFIEY